MTVDNVQPRSRAWLCHLACVAATLAFPWIPGLGAADSAAQCTAIPTDVRGWWPLDETTVAAAHDVHGLHHGSYVGSPSTATGVVRGALACAPGNYVQVPHADEIDVGANTGTQGIHAEMTLMAWLNPGGAVGVRRVLTKRTSQTGFRLQLQGSFGASHRPRLIARMNGQDTNYQIPQSSGLSASGWSHLAVTMVSSDEDPSASELRWYVNGVLVETTPFPALKLENSADLLIGPNDGLGGVPLILDEVMIFQRALDASEVSAIYDAGNQGACPTDCNDNDAHDLIDIAEGVSSDDDDDGVPDECGCDPACQQWHLQPAMGPSPRRGAAVAYDEERDVTVLFGGHDGTQLLDDTWLWDGTTWMLVPPAAGPSPRSEAGAAYDASRQVVVLYGGAGSSGRVDDTWEWDGVSWSPSPAPPAGTLSEMGMAYDPVNEVIVRYGGTDGVTGRSKTTWEYTGTSWDVISSNSPPSYRSHLAMAFDPQLQKTVMFGGQKNGSIEMSDTWTYDAVTNQWEILSISGPSARRNHSLTQNSTCGTLMLFGGSNDNGSFRDIWLFENGSWSQAGLAPTTLGPTERHAVAYQAGTQQMVLFGGRNGQSLEFNPYTWAYSCFPDPDPCIVTTGGPEDCNSNGISDACELAAGTLADCDDNGIPDPCDAESCEPGCGYTWIGPDQGDFHTASHWDGGGVPSLGAALLENEGAVDNTCVLDSPGTTTVCAVQIDGNDSPTAWQSLRIETGSVLDTDTQIGTFGRVELEGGDLNGQTDVVVGGEITGFGDVGPLDNAGLVTADGGQIFISGNFVNQASGLLRAMGTGNSIRLGEILEAQFGAIEVQDGGAFTVRAIRNDGSIDVRAGVFKTITGNIVNSSGRTITAETTVPVDANGPWALHCRGGMYNSGTVVLQDASIRVDPTPFAVYTGGNLTSNGQSFVTGKIHNYTSGTLRVNPGVLNVSNCVTNFGLIELDGDLEILGECSSGEGLHNTVYGTVTRLGGSCIPPQSPWCKGPSSSGKGAPEVTLRVDKGLYSEAGSALYLPQVRIETNGNVDIAIDDGEQCRLGQTTVVMTGLEGAQTFEVMAPERGLSVDLSEVDLFPIDELVVAAGADVSFVNNRDNGGGAKEGLYLRSLVLEPGSRIDLAGRQIFYESVVPADPFAAGSGVTVEDSGGPFGPGSLLAVVNTVGVSSPTGQKPRMILDQNTPNPFNPSTTISFETSREGPVSIRVFDVRGKVLRILVDDVVGAGRHTVSWNGQDGGGNQVASGMYFYEMRAGEYRHVRRMALLK